MAVQMGCVCVSFGRLLTDLTERGVEGINDVPVVERLIGKRSGDVIVDGCTSSEGG